MCSTVTKKKVLVSSSSVLNSTQVKADPKKTKPTLDFCCSLFTDWRCLQVLLLICLSQIGSKLSLGPNHIRGTAPASWVKKRNQNDSPNSMLFLSLIWSVENRLVEHSSSYVNFLLRQKSPWHYFEPCRAGCAHREVGPEGFLTECSYGRRRWCSEFELPPDVLDLRSAKFERSIKFGFGGSQRIDLRKLRILAPFCADFDSILMPTWLGLVRALRQEEVFDESAHQMNSLAQFLQLLRAYDSRISSKPPVISPF